MKGVDTIARIRREFSIRGKTIKEIARELHVSRNTVRKVRGQPAAAAKPAVAAFDASRAGPGQARDRREGRGGRAPPTSEAATGAPRLSR
jgi:transposase-like protein